MSGEVKVLDKMPERIPVNGTFELTIRCNLHCKMCLFRHDDSENAEIMANELTAEQWIDMGRQVAEAGTIKLLITGGEPLMRPDFCEIWEGLYKIGFIMTLYTNATLVTDKVMECLKKYPPHIVGVTVYGASQETYSRVCESKEAFSLMKKGVKELQALPSELQFRSTLIKDNYQEVGAIRKMIQDEFCADFSLQLSQPVVKAVRGACAKVEKCRVEPEEDVKYKLKETVNNLEQILGHPVNLKSIILSEKYRGNEPGRNANSNPTFFGCQAGISQYTITYDGKLLPCQMMGAFYTDTCIGGFKIAWNELPKIINIDYKKEQCSSCKYLRTCSSCFASRYAETGDVNGCSDYIYQTAKWKSILESVFGRKKEYEKDNVCEA